MAVFVITASGRYQPSFFVWVKHKRSLPLPALTILKKASDIFFFQFWLYRFSFFPFKCYTEVQPRPRTSQISDVWISDGYTDWDLRRAVSVEKLNNGDDQMLNFGSACSKVSFYLQDEQQRRWEKLFTYDLVRFII